MPVLSEAEKLKSTNRILVVALIIASFFLGSLTNKVATYENGTSPIAAAKDVKQAADDTTAPAVAAKKPKSITSADHTRGDKNAKVTLIEYSDFECPFCKNFHQTILELQKTYGDKIKMVYRHYPLSFHENAQKEAEGSECVAELGGNDAFWKFTDTIYERTTSNGTGFALSALGPLAAEFGVDQNLFQSCLDSGKYEKLVKDSFTEGSSAGVSGTPATFINEKLIVGACPLSVFDSAIKAELENNKTWSVTDCQFVN